MNITIAVYSWAKQLKNHMVVIMFKSFIYNTYTFYLRILILSPNNGVVCTIKPTNIFAFLLSYTHDAFMLQIVYKFDVLIHMSL